MIKSVYGNDVFNIAIMFNNVEPNASMTIGNFSFQTFLVEILKT